MFNKKAQIFVYDMMVAFVLVALAITLIIFSWNRSNNRLDEKIAYNDMQNAAFNVLDVMIKTQGKPFNWEDNPENVSAVGLALSDRILSENKIEAFMNLSYSKTRTTFGLPYDFYFVIKETNKTIIKAKGLTPIGEKVVNVERKAIYQNKPVIVEFVVVK